LVCGECRLLHPVLTLRDGKIREREASVKTLLLQLVHPLQGLRSNLAHDVNTLLT